MKANFELRQKPDQPGQLEMLLEGRWQPYDGRPQYGTSGSHATYRESIIESTRRSASVAPVDQADPLQRHRVQQAAMGLGLGEEEAAAFAPPVGCTSATLEQACQGISKTPEEAALLAALLRRA